MNGLLTQRPMDSSGGVAGPSHQLSANMVNSFRVQTVADRLAMHIRLGNQSEPNEFFNLCLSLARGIDFAVSNNEIPPRAQDLPLLLKQVCQRKKELHIQAAIMVLMISVKSACTNGWFLNKDADELLTLAHEIWSNFSNPAEITIEPSVPPPVISKVMSSFFPQMKTGRILASLEVKPGFGTFVVDFPIPKNTVTAEERIRLFVVQTDNIGNSSCLVTPAQVNFLLNGKGVEKRITSSMDSGPQFPSNVTQMLKYGTNLLQAIGLFNGNYLIAIAVMSTIESSDVPVLQDYVQPIATSLESDSELIEGPSRISLNCPISFKRIKTPIKGQLCKHIQCFDYENYIDINSRRPSWRCPICNQCVCYTEIRMDQSIAKILKEVGENVADVMISSDGTWKPVLENGDRPGDLHDKTLSKEQEGVEKCESTRFSNTQTNVVDLTAGGSCENDPMDTSEPVDRKPSKDALQNCSPAGNPSVPVSNADEGTQTTTQIEDYSWRGILLSCSAASDGFATPSTSQLYGTNHLLTPVLTDAISPALNREPMDARGATQPLVSIPQSQYSPFNNLLLQPSQVGNSLMSSELGRPCIPRNITRNPIAVQALPAPGQVSISNQRPHLNLLVPNGAPYSPSQTSPSAALSQPFHGETERPQQFSRSLLNPLSASDMSSSAMQHHTMTQTWGHQDRSYMASRPFQQVVGLPASIQVPNSFRGPPGFTQDRQASPHQAAPNMRMNQMMHQPMQHQQSTQNVPSQASGSTSNPSNRFMVPAQRSNQMARSPPAVPVQLQAPRMGSYQTSIDGVRTSMGEQRGNLGGTPEPVSRPDEQNWRPTGRMRGSLSGQSYSAALSQFVIRPTQPTQASRPAAPDLTPRGQPQ